MPREQIVLFADTLEQRIPEDHPVRILDEILSRLDRNEWEAEYHGKFGQPLVHPSVICKTLLFAMIRRIRSSRQIEYNLRHSIDFMWLASGRTIDHATLSEFRRKHPQQLKDLYRQMVQLAINLGVAKLAELCIDGTRVLANTSRYKTLTAEKVERLLQELDQQITAAMSELDFGETPLAMLGDGAYGTGPNLEAMEEREIELLSPPLREQPQDNPALREDPTQAVADDDLDRLPISAQTKRFDKQAFVYDEEADVYYCPAGKPLPREGTEQVQRSGTTIEQVNYRCHECAGCPLAERCRKNPAARQGRKVTLDGYEAVRRRHSERMQQADAKERYKRRQHYIEGLAHGLTGARELLAQQRKQRRIFCSYRLEEDHPLFF